MHFRLALAIGLPLVAFACRAASEPPPLPPTPEVVEAKVRSFMASGLAGGEPIPVPPPPPPFIVVTDADRPALNRLMFDVEEFHDPCIFLIDRADEESIPALILALRAYPDEEPEGVDCAWLGCVEALRRVTGAHPGFTYSSWRRWWDETHPGVRLEPWPTPYAEQVAALEHAE